jgi:hypothetical protein
VTNRRPPSTKGRPKRPRRTVGPRSDPEGRRPLRRRVLVAVGLLLGVLVGAPVLAQDMTGTWELSSESPRGSRTMILAVVQDGSELTGTLTMTRGGRRGGGGGGGGGGAAGGRGGGQPMEIQISDGVVEDGDFSFSATMERGGNTMVLKMTGRFEGDEASGMIEGGRGGGPFTGKRSN